MKTSEIRELTTKELAERVEEEKGMFAKMKINHAVSPLENPLKIKHARKQIARLMTELNKRTLTEKQ
ncbi:MAG TPA: 50S ribosomal protein L29 [Bacteroidales bacterium]|nr:MAG: 50S ribosomal protein L29 [Bacteroidetes bacterium GWF2_33_38]OFY76412.1 MAG: 50S ribosomal protein L29 [Bacteroidetes bacterium RIFOXYA12_FULL_33_9]OFY90345.1 MAG: 50S ribosomal protein L29 [Bacteroidetes bacterium RIFOXYA2_FULL_33_7]HBF88160.1 50S ribosomal protein L29 [Bacteroidales bacterium]